MRMSDWSSDVCSSDLASAVASASARRAGAGMAAGAGDRKRDVAGGRAARITGRLPWQVTKQCKCYNISILGIDPAESHGSTRANLTHESPPPRIPRPLRTPEERRVGKEGDRTCSYGGSPE